MNPTRRDFLKRGLTATGALAIRPTQAFGRSVSSSSSAQSGTEPVLVPGVHAYADRESVAPGERIQFFLSTDRPVGAAIYRLGVEVDNPSGDQILEDFGPLGAASQPIRPGSYLHVEKRLRKPFSEFTIESWVRPWRVDRLMGIVSQEDKASSEGWALGIGKDGYVGFYLGDGHSEDEALVHRSATGLVIKGTWHHLVARWDGMTKDVWVDGKPVGQWPFKGPLLPGPQPIRLGAMGEKGYATHLLDGDLASTAIHGKALSNDTIRQHFEGHGRSPLKSADLLGGWVFHEESGSRVSDLSRHRRHARIVNHATWMIGGPSFDASVPRFGNYSPGSDELRGHGLRLASDDLYDCEWEPTLSWRAPADGRSGMYVLRLTWQSNGKEFFQHVTFIVRRPRRRRPSPILLLAATNTWRAYNAAAFGKPRAGLRQLCGTDGLPNEAGDPPAFSFYRGHAAGQGCYQLGSRMPWPASSPYLRYGDGTDYSHLARADRFTQTWLEREGYEYEMITDFDLHKDPGQLRRHRVFIINGHSEYWSIEMYRGLEEYLAAGGQVVVLSGNSLFWRVTYDASGTILECRKVDAPGNQLAPELRGEAWHSHDGKRGGMLRECGYPGWRLIGLETLGWNNQGNVKNFGPWIAEQVDHPVFHHPEKTGLKSGDRFGAAPDGKAPIANGHEFDVRLSTLAKLAAGPVPPGAEMPSDPPGIQRLANGVIPWQHGGAAFDYFFRPIRPDNEQGGEMIWWERREGGVVFNAGSIGAGWALHADPRWGALLRNVLHRFGVPRPEDSPSNQV